MGKSNKRKVVVTTGKNDPVKKKIKPTISRRTKQKSASGRRGDGELLFNRQNYMWMIIGIGLIALGLILMLGGSLPPDVWDDSVIYSTRITVLGPFTILIGLAIEIYAIFKD